MKLQNNGGLSLFSVVPQKKPIDYITEDNLFERLILNNSELKKTVISGGNTFSRNNAVCALINVLISKHIPVFVLHNSNRALCNRFNCKNCSGFAPASANHIVGFDPLANIKPQNAISILSDFGSEFMQIGSEFHCILDIAFEIMDLCNITVCTSSVCNFPWSGMAEYVIENNTISDERKVSLLHRIGAVASMLPRVQTLFSELNMRIMRNSNSIDCSEVYGIKDFVINSAVIFADIYSDGNEIISEFYLSALKFAKEMGAKFYIVIDSIPVSDTSNNLKHFLKSNDTRASCMFVSPDVCNLEDKDFNILTGNGTNVVIFSHSSGISANKWSEYFSEFYYSKCDITMSESKVNTSFITKTNNRGSTITEERRRCIPPEEIINLPPSRAIVSLGTSNTQCKGYTTFDFN